jgi:broad specificity phosphatase PhoE
MLKVILLRHGETPYNADGNRYCGRTDLELTEKGLRQAAKVAAILKGTELAAVYSSPLVRARVTAEIASGGADVVTDARLVEVDFGLWEGKRKEEFQPEDPAVWQRWMGDPETAKAGGIGESGGEVVKRMNAFFEEMQIKHNGQTIMVVAHNGVNRLFLASQMGMPLSNYRRFDMENSSVSYFELGDDGVIVLKKLNAGSLE